MILSDPSMYDPPSDYPGADNHVQPRTALPAWVLEEPELPAWNAASSEQ